VMVSLGTPKSSISTGLITAMCRPYCLSTRVYRPLANQVQRTTRYPNPGVALLDYLGHQLRSRFGCFCVSCFFMNEYHA
jgi:hypothetical protein